MKDSSKIKSTARQPPEDASHWAFINDWHVEEQSNDRLQASGVVAHNSDDASVRRSVARRAHQLEYKVWSKQRHD